MKPLIEIIHSAEMTTSTWSGGTTTQLAIWPDGSSYPARDFAWRVNTAKVETEESEFTSLPGIHRILMVLDGELILSHEGRGQVKLNCFQQTDFMGDWHTVSRGRVTDFNLMISEGQGSVETLTIPTNETIISNAFPAPPNWPCATVLFYSLCDELSVEAGEKRSCLSTGDLLSIRSGQATPQETVCIHNDSDRDAHMIKTVIFHR